MHNLIFNINDAEKIRCPGMAAKYLPPDREKGPDASAKAQFSAAHYGH